MSDRQISRRNLLKVIGVASAGSVLAACGGAPAATTDTAPNATEPQVPASTAAPADNKVTILHWAQGAEPTDPNTPPEEGQAKHVAYQEIADAYMKEHPNVTIEWYRFPAGSNTSEWLQARMTAQDAPDIYWANTEDLWPHINKNWALDFTEYMKQPNPYVEGNTAWQSQFEDVAVYSQTGPDGKLYGVNMDGAGVMTVYNQAAFNEAGVTRVPKTWNELIAACQKLQDKGYIPYGADMSPETCCYPHWTSAHIYNQLVWDKVYSWDDDGNKVITSKELVSHAQKGDFMDWDAYLKFMQLVKELTPYFPTGYEGQVDYRQLFRQGKVAMYLEGNWAVSEFKASPPPFEIGWMAYPMITKDIWPTAPEKVVRIQGAWGAMQYHVPGYLKDTAPDKIPVIMDWLMYSSKPENVGKVCMETGLVPLTKGAEGLPELKPFYEPYDRAVPYQSWGTLSPSAMQAEYRLMQGYLPSVMSDDDFLNKAKSELKLEVDKLLEANPEWKITT